jgi:acetylornithine deacetylase/succinyl-diaminopimelate desuccinylase-like protein
LWDILNRRGVPAEIYEPPNAPPLLIAGSGSVLVVAHLDDAHPAAQVDGVLPPTIVEGIAQGPGVARKGAVLAAIGLVATQTEPSDATLIVEIDRYAGSRSLEAWLDGPGRLRHFPRALVEVADLPAPAPAIFRAATGQILLDVTITDDRPHVESAFTGVVTDIGHELAHALGSLKSSDGEVLVAGFYDGVQTPEAAEIVSLHGIAPYVSSWISRDRPGRSTSMSSTHLTLGAFLAPALSVSVIDVRSSAPWLARTGRAVVEARIMPGQDASAITRAIVDHLCRRSEHIQVVPSLVRPPASGASTPTTVGDVVVYPLSVGDTPAGLLESANIAALGFSTVWRDPAAIDEQIDFAAIDRGTAFLRQLVTSE